MNIYRNCIALICI